VRDLYRHLATCDVAIVQGGTEHAHVDKANSQDGDGSLVLVDADQIAGREFGRLKLRVKSRSRCGTSKPPNPQRSIGGGVLETVGTGIR
jgi:hypothetical protein